MFRSRSAAVFLPPLPFPNQTPVAALEMTAPPAPRQDEAVSRIGGPSLPAEGGWSDWWAGTRRVDLWSTLAWYDIVLRYRR